MGKDQDVGKKVRSLFLEQLCRDFQDRITGGNGETLRDEDPESRFMVGKLSAARTIQPHLAGGVCEGENADASDNTSTVYISSMGMDFRLPAEEGVLENTVLRIHPRGEFYYRCLPTLEEQRAAVLQEAQDVLRKPLGSIEDLLKEKKLAERSYDLRLVFRSCSLGTDLESGAPFELRVRLADLMDESGETGSLEEETPSADPEQGKVQELLDRHLENLRDNGPDKDLAYRAISTSDLRCEHLKTEQAFRRFLNQKQAWDIRQTWKVCLRVDVKKVRDRERNWYLVSVFLENPNRTALSGELYQQRKTKEDWGIQSVDTLFNAGLDVCLEGGVKPIPMELNCFRDDYKYDRRQMAVGRSCSVSYDGRETRFSTENIPIYEQRRLITKNEKGLDLTFETLGDQGRYRQPLVGILNMLEKEEGRWKERLGDPTGRKLQNWLKMKGLDDHLSDADREQLESEIQGFHFEIERFRRGVEMLQDDPSYDVRKSFLLMNQTFRNATANKGYHSWRLFQIVYIVSLIPDIVACDFQTVDRRASNLDKASLLYFPTGGGKTEAFLGILIFNLFFDRFRGKWCGVTALLRYPLRLLSIQQVQRLADILAQAELLRREEPKIADTEEFSLGYFVGASNTPNRISRGNAREYAGETAGDAAVDRDEFEDGDKLYRRLKRLKKTDLDKEYRLLDFCPFCGGEDVHVRFDVPSYRLAHYCGDPACPSHAGADSGQRFLPLYMVDDEIYRYLPSTIISTVDKMAILGFNGRFRGILAGAKYRCPVHGFTQDGRCSVFGCTEGIQPPFLVPELDPGMKPKALQMIEKMRRPAPGERHGMIFDPAPSLFIQDELHLVRESLGTYSAHYESFLQWFVENVSPSRRKAKVIGATATITNYEEQIKALYSRAPICFPCAYPDLEENCYAKLDDGDIQRRIIGYAPFGRASVNAVIYSMKYMREAVYAYLEHPEKLREIPGMEELLPEPRTEAEREEYTRKVREILDDYWIFLEYNNVKRDGNNVEGALKTPVNEQLSQEGVPEFVSSQMTGNEGFREVLRVLEKVQSKGSVLPGPAERTARKKGASDLDGLNTVIATSTISHGVDADRFNLMFFFGMPGNTAEYIQAYSRTGRKHPGLVVDIIRPSRETDMSYLNNFKNYHKFKDILVEPVPIDRWATNAVRMTLPGLFAGLMLNCYLGTDLLNILQAALLGSCQECEVRKADPEACERFLHPERGRSPGRDFCRGMVCPERVKKDLREIYKCVLEGGSECSVEGAMYFDEIGEMVDEVFRRIKEGNWSIEDRLSTVFADMGLWIMSSMRDTDKDLLIGLVGSAEGGSGA